MADNSPVIQGSSPAMRRISQSANLAEKLSSITNENQVDDNLNYSLSKLNYKLYIPQNRLVFKLVLKILRSTMDLSFSPNAFQTLVSLHLSVFVAGCCQILRDVKLIFVSCSAI